MNVKGILFEDWNLKKECMDTQFILIMVVKLPNGKKEIIQNFGEAQIEEKMNYYNQAYNDELELNHNNEIKIVDWLFV